MAQYEIVKLVYESDTPLTQEEITSSMDLSKGSVRAGIRESEAKGWIEKTSGGYIATTNLTEEKLEDIRPKSLDELMD